MIDDPVEDAVAAAPGDRGRPSIVAALLAEFHERFEQPFGHGNVRDSALRRRLHEEEHTELLEAFDAADLAAVAASSYEVGVVE